MAQPKDGDETTVPGQGRRAAQMAAAPEAVASPPAGPQPGNGAVEQRGAAISTGSNQQAATSTGSTQPAAGATGATQPATIARRKQTYLIGIRPWPGFASMMTDSIVEALTAMEGVEIVRRMRPRGFQALTAGGAAGAQEIIVARMDETRGEALRQSAPPHVVVEVNAPLGYAEMMSPAPLGLHLGGQVIPLPGRRQDIRFRVVGEGERPLSGATVFVYGSGFPSQAVTDSSGQAVVTTYDVTADPQSAQAVYVKPAADHWERFIQNPELNREGANVIRLAPLPKPTAKGAGERPFGWGQRIMKLDQLGTGLTGAGVKIGLIDSGCDNTHPALRHVTKGADLTRKDDGKSWATDEIGHGTHSAGIIAAGAGAPEAVCGFAPGAELHVFKMFPGGHLSDLIEALDQCIERGLDIVHLSLGSENGSEFVVQKIAEARSKGVACIVAAGDSGGPLQFPGNVPGVFTVSAVGKFGEFPADTRHAQSAYPYSMGANGIFATNFSCFGPQVAACAPGVAVISSVPGGGYGARDGTSIAAAHITGFAAILLAHHPLFQGPYKNRGEHRIMALFELMRSAAIPLMHVDPARVGAGLPDFQRVPGLLPSAQQGPWVGIMPGERRGWGEFQQGLGQQALAQHMLAQQGIGQYGAPPPYLANPLALMRAAGLI